VKRGQIDIDRVLQELVNELIDRRADLSLNRAQAVALMEKKLGVAIGDRTLLAYEHSARSLTVRRLLELCVTYEQSAPGILASAFARAEQHRCPTCGHH
jgi:hypothetical protein